ncbi:MAG TPA: hypothetical protein VGO07_02100, partial [Candidatus Saccharimonadales bacterium]|nr:hypothetical protein [Candidatus Saccharimonadales bacterium]
MDNGKKNFRPANGRGNNSRKGMRNAGFVALLILFGLIIWAAYGQGSTLQNTSLSSAIRDANAGKYSKVEVDGNELSITKK